MGLRNLISRNTSRNRDRSQYDGVTEGGRSDTSALSGITPNLISILQQNRMISRNTAVLPGMARDMGVIRQGITKLAKVKDVKSTDSADSFNWEADKLEEDYESARRNRSPTRTVESKSGKEPSFAATFFSGLLSMFKSGLGALFSKKGLLATGILAALFPKESISMLEGLANGLRILTIGVLGASRAFADLALFLSDTFNLGPVGTMVASTALVGGGLWAGKKLLQKSVGSVKGAFSKSAAPAAAESALTPERKAEMLKRKADNLFKKPFGQRFAEFIKLPRVQAFLIQNTGKRLGTSYALAATGIGTIPGILLSIGLTGWAIYEFIDMFLEWDQDADDPLGKSPEQQAQAEDIIDKTIKEEEDANNKWRNHMREVHSQFDKNIELLKNPIVFTALSDRAGVKEETSPGATSTPSGSSGSPTPASLGTPGTTGTAGTTPTQIRVSDYIREKLLADKEMGLTDDDASAIIANLSHESALNPYIVQQKSGAVGIAQWLGTRRDDLYNFAKIPKSEIAAVNLLEGPEKIRGHENIIKKIPLEKQVEFMIAELKGKITNTKSGTRVKALKNLKAAKGIKEKTTAFERDYEVSGKYINGIYKGDSMEKRWGYVADASKQNIDGATTGLTVPNTRFTPESVVTNITNNHNNGMGGAGGDTVLSGVLDSEFFRLLQRRASEPQFGY